MSPDVLPTAEAARRFGCRVSSVVWCFRRAGLRPVGATITASGRVSYLWSVAAIDAAILRRAEVRVANARRLMSESARVRRNERLRAYWQQKAARRQQEAA